MMQSSEQQMEFIWRRLEEPAELFGRSMPFEPRWWLAIAVPILLFVLIWSIRTYLKESKTIGKVWSLALATCRILFYVLIFTVWLLPAMRQIEYSRQQSKVLMLLDVSASMQTSDDSVPELPEPLRRSRQEILIDLLTTTQNAVASNPANAEIANATQPTPTSSNKGPTSNRSKPLLTRLLEKNPILCYRFGELLDPVPWRLQEGSKLTNTEWMYHLEPPLRPSLDMWIPPDLVGEFVRIARSWKPEQALPEQRELELADNLEKSLFDRQQKLDRLLNRTNPGAALRELLRKESTNHIQGVILFSDGLRTSGSEQDWQDAIDLARKEKIPIFTVGIGQRSQTPNLRIVDLLAPSRIQPEDEFPVRVALGGEHLQAGQPVNVHLRIEKPNGPPEDKKQSVRLTPGPGRTTRGAAEFRVTNPERLKGDWKLTAWVEAMRGERTRADNATPEPTIVKVEDRKLSVLLIASGPSREYQFVRSLLTREPDKFDLAIYLQSAQPGTVQDIDPKRLLTKFPTDLRDRDADPMNLGNYDVIIAFDIDWKLVPHLGAGDKPSPQAHLQRWVEQMGGGLIFIAGPVHTFALARDPELNIIRQLYPVQLDDTASSVLQIDRQVKVPFALNWEPAAANMPFLDLTDLNNPSRALEGWEFYFDVNRNPETGQAEGPARRGFYSFFPLMEAKPGTAVLARFGDPDAKALTPNGQKQPFFVMSKFGKGPVFYIGSGETYRLRQFSEMFHERFWTKLLRYMGKRESARGMMVVGNRFTEGETVSVEVELLDATLNPLSRAEFVGDMILKVIPLDEGKEVKPQSVRDEGLRTVARRYWLSDLNTKDKVKTEPTPSEWENYIHGLLTQPRLRTEPEIIGTPGKFLFRFAAGRIGKYRLELAIPGSSERLQARYKVEAADPERDDPRPDFNWLYKLASSHKEISLLDPSKRQAFQAALQQSRQTMLLLNEEESLSKKTVQPSNENEERLFFDVTTAPWIAECLDTNIITFRTEGKAKDIWDKGITVFGHLDDPDQASGISWVLVFGMCLLGFEWLARKLLRLA